ncbi:MULTISPECIES: hypothetical protein [Amycolatopsis]|uniref:hypothetical protein n=1 Tax=Amycolatopsis TaxID=1813 RepID=UPI00174AEAAA|nr:hypothetical protein [Amycolatopsis bullii]
MLLSLQRSVGNRAVGLVARGAVQRTVAFTRDGTPVSSVSPEEIWKAFNARMDELRSSIPEAWWVDGKAKTQLSRLSIGKAFRAARDSPTDHGTVALDSSDDLFRFCRLLIGIATGAGGNTAVGGAPSTAAPAGALAGAAAPAAPGNRQVPALTGHPKYDQMSAVIVTERVRDEIVPILDEWEEYAEQKWNALRPLFQDLKDERVAMGVAYYSAENERIRARSKSLRTAFRHLGGAKDECKSVAKGLRAANGPGLASFAALYHGTQLQGVVEWNYPDASRIENIAGNPHNIVVPTDVQPPHVRPVRGVAAALLALTVAQHRSHAKPGQPAADIALFALNNKVKPIYDRYYFQVFAGKKLHPRPKREDRVAKRAAGHKPEKETWHQKRGMVLSHERADKLLKDVQPHTWLAVPDTLRPYLQPQ